MQSGIDTKVGTSGDTAGTATLFGQVKDISKKMPTGAVKGVQVVLIRNQTGLSSTTSDELIPITTYYYDFTISKVNPEKTIVLTSMLARLSASNTNLPVARIVDNGNKVRVYLTGTSEHEINNTMVQVIEYL